MADERAERLAQEYVDEVVWTDGTPDAEGFASRTREMIRAAFLAGYRAATRWIPVGEELPKGGQECGCHDCRRTYGDKYGFPDLIIPLEQWKMISPTGSEGGLLCPSCICKRLHEAGINQCPGAFMSGPIRSVDPFLMENMRWVENLRLEKLANGPLLADMPEGGEG